MLEYVRKFISQHIELTEEEFQILASKLHLVSFDKKTKLVEIGEVATTFYFVLKGISRRYFYRGKQEVITHLIKEGGMMGSVISFLPPSRAVMHWKQLNQLQLLPLKKRSGRSFLNRQKMGEIWKKDHYCIFFTARIPNTR
jgi:signal-transduction protein with cAMP-binding, CBS, and nucleotidyltransferase domain